MNSGCYEELGESGIGGPVQWLTLQDVSGLRNPETLIIDYLIREAEYVHVHAERYEDETDDLPVVSEESG